MSSATRWSRRKRDRAAEITSSDKGSSADSASTGVPAKKRTRFSREKNASSSIATDVVMTEASPLSAKGSADPTAADVAMADPTDSVAQPNENDTKQPNNLSFGRGKRQRKASAKAVEQAAADAEARAEAQAKKVAKKTTAQAKQVRKNARKNQRRKARKAVDAEEAAMVAACALNSATNPSSTDVNTTASSTAVNATDATPTLSATDQATAAKGVALAKKKATAAVKQAEKEAVNGPRCIAHERKLMQDNAPTTDLSTPDPPRRPFDRADAQPIKVGDHVRVAQDLTSGHYCHGGIGWVSRTSGTGAATTACVRWFDKASRDTNRHGPAYGSNDVPLRRLTKVSVCGTLPVRDCRQRAAVAAAAAARAALITPVPTLSVAPIQEQLLLAKLRGKVNGWRRTEVCGPGGKRLTVEQKLLAGADGKALCSFLDGYKAGGGHPVAHLRPQRIVGGGYKLVQSDKSWEGTKPLTKDFLAWSWGMGRGRLNNCISARHTQQSQPL
jgi:hypothetical protein